MATYVRQSSFSDGDTITAALFNNEFNQLVNAFNVATGHTHDGSTAGDGGPISNLFSNALVFGTNTDNDVVITFNANSNDGVLTWMEDEDYFQFSDDLLLTTTEKVQFRDTAIYINSSTDGQLDIVADTEIQIAATTIDMNGNADISGNLGVGGNLTVTGTTTFNGGTITMGDAATDNVVFGADVDSNIIPDDDDTYDLGSSTQQWRNLYIDGTANIDSLVADTADINGGTIDAANITVGSGKTLDVSAGSLTLANNQISGDKVEGGTINATTINTLTYGSITDGTITVTAFVDEDNMASNSATLIPTQQSVKAYVDAQDTAQDLDLVSDSGTIAIDLDGETLTVTGGEGIDTSASSNTLTITGEDATTSNKGIASFNSDDFNVSSGAVTLATTSTAAELNLLDGTTAGTIVASKGVAVDANKDITGFRNITLTGELDAGSLDVSGNVDVDGTLETDALSINGTAVTSTAAELNILDGKAFLDEDDMASNSATGIASQQSIKAYVDTQITAEDLDITTDSGTIAIDLDSETLTVSGGTGLDSSATGNAVTLAIDSTVATLTGSQTLTNKSLTAPTLTGTATVASLDISGNIDVDGTTNLDVVDIDGAVDMASTLAVGGVVTANAGVKVDNFTLDGTTLALSSGNLTLDVAGDIKLDADSSNIYLADGGTDIGLLSTNNQDLNIRNLISNKDIYFQGNDGGSVITALTLDMSAAGAATFNAGATLGGVLTVNSGTTNTVATFTSSDSGAGINLTDNSGTSNIQTNGANLRIGVDEDGAVSSSAIQFRVDGSTKATINDSGVFTSDGGVVVDNITIDGNEIDVGSGDLTLDVAGDIILDADGGEVFFKDGGTSTGKIRMNDGDLQIRSLISDKDITLEGNDNGTIFEAMRLDMSAAGAATFGGVVTANAGVVVDNITIDGNEIDLSSGDLTIDVAGDIIFDADGDDFIFAAAGTNIGKITNSSSDFLIRSLVQDKDIIFKGADGGSTITALTLDMSAAGAANFNSTITAVNGTFTEGNSGAAATSGSANNLVLENSSNAGLTIATPADGIASIFYSDPDSNAAGYVQYNHSTNLHTIFSTGDIALDAGNDTISLKDSGTQFGEFISSSTDFVIKSSVSDKDIIFKGNDGGSAITALTLDMSAGGDATFNAKVNVGENLLMNNNYEIRFKDSGGTERTAIELDNSNNFVVGTSASGVHKFVGGGGYIERFRINTDGSVVFNETSLDQDFRVESNNNANMLFVDGGNDRITIGGNDGTGSLHVKNKDNSGADVHVVVQNTTNNRIAGYKIQDESGNTGINLLYDNGGNTATLESPIGNLTLDVAGDIILDADGGDLEFKDGSAGTLHSWKQGVYRIPEQAAGTQYNNSLHNHTNNYQYIIGGSNGLILADNTDQSNRIIVDNGLQIAFDINGVSTAKFTQHGGIAFGSDNSAATTLDDYEEGTWTPDLRGGTSAGTTTYGAREGWYTKVGDLVTINALIYNTNFTGSGLAEIHGLPFTADGESTGDAQINGHDSSFPSTLCNLTSIIQDNAIIHMRGTFTTQHQDRTTFNYKDLLIYE